MHTKVKICFILSHFPQGGAERQIFLLISELIKNKSDFDITLVLYNNEPCVFYREIFQLPVKIILNNERIKGNKILKLISKVRFLKSILNKNEFDIIHTLLFHNGFWVRLLAPKKYKNRIVYSIRNNLKDSNFIFRLFEKIFIGSTYVVTNSLNSQIQFINLVGNKFKNNVINIYNGFETNKFFSLNPCEVNSIISIGTIGRQTKQKNQSQIIRVLPKLVKDYKIHFYLLGDKTLEKATEIQSLILEYNLGNYISIMDSQLNIEEYYKKFNIFILSSLYEGCPNVLFEALLSRCLCIISEGANSDNFIIDGCNGLVYDGSDSMLEKKMIQAFDILNDNIILNEITENGYNYAIENFSIEKMTNQYIGLYKNVLD